MGTQKILKKGDRVIDIFAGLGTTLLVAEKLGRVGYGIEIDPKRVAFIKTKLKTPNHVLLGDSLKLDEYSFPKIDLCITSPIYMQKKFTRNPLRNNAKGTYDEYLQDIHIIFKKLKKHLKRHGYVVVEVSNLKNDSGVTTLAWDMCKEISTVLRFEGEVVINWKGPMKDQGSYGYGYNHSYALIFQKDG